MNLKQQIEQDLKTAMLAGDRQLTSTLRGLKSSILYEEVARGKREEGLTDEEITAVLGKEAKKRQESADLYTQGGNGERAQAELAEKASIEKYLPSQLSDDEINKLINSAETEIGSVSPQTMGRIIAAVKSNSQGAADGARVASLVKERLK